MTDPKRSLLDPAVLAKLGTLKLRVRAVTEGILSGLHRSPHHGQSVEFAEHKEYAPGDDVRRIDWKAYGKFDKYYVKQFEQETNLRCYLVVDASGSMGWRGAEGRLTKLEYASSLAASLAYLLVRQADAAGLVLCGDRVVRAIPPAASAGHLVPLLDALSGAVPAGETRLGAAVDWIVEHAPRRAAVVVLTDLFDKDERALKQLAQLARRKHEVTLFHVLDPAELDFGYEDASSFQDLESGEQIPVVPESLAAEYRSMITAHIEALTTKFSEHRIDYTLLNTAEPLDRALFSYLSSRERLMRVR